MQVANQLWYAAGARARASSIYDGVKVQEPVPINNISIETFFANMDRMQEMIRYLTAAGGTPSRDGKSIYLTYEEKGSLCMKIWTRSELIDKVWIAENIRPGTPAPVVNRNHLVGKP